MSDKLTQKQEQSCHDYVETGNKTEAYRRNYSTKNMTENTLNVEANKHFNNPKISQRVKQLQEKAEERNELSQDIILQELGNIALFDIRCLFDEHGNFLKPNELSEKAGKAISSVKSVTKYNKEGDAEVTMEYRLNNKNTSIDQINKMLGYYEKDNEQTKHNLTIEIE